MIDLSSLVYELDRQSTSPLFVQLSNAIRHRIVSGEIMPRLRLPPSRSLATDLDLSRSTITNAYEQLVAEGYIEGRRGSGFYSCPIGEIEFNPEPEGSHDPQLSGPPAESRKRLHPGSPDMRLFPYRQWAQCVSRVARLAPKALISTDDSFGNIQLRQSIARYLKDWRGLEASAEQILITAGSIDALEICVRTLADSGDYVGLENPGYQPLRNIVLNLGLRPFWLAAGEHGPEVPQIKLAEAVPKLTILTPSHQFPLGGAMSPLKRREFLQWAEQTDSWIIEDDYDSEFRYAGSPIQALAGFDTTDRTIYVGTFSKIFSEGLRLGFLVAPVSLLTEFSNTLSRFGVKAASASQAALSSFLDSGEFYRHLRRCRRIYAERRKFLISLLQQRLDDVISFEDHAAGMQLLARLPPGYDDQIIVKAASKQGVFVSALSSHYSKGDKQHGLLLGFCGFTEEEIESNISVIERIIREL
ncbi:MAG: PLP-dependent aminotransferase family protein [Gammaproteobacteria bacterium]|nr:PLP-dependent aminotransferase family protein [Gammaproteobacteria bacterium]